jgi:hypothetical protein
VFEGQLCNIYDFSLDTARNLARGVRESEIYMSLVDPLECVHSSEKLDVLF